MFHARAIAAFLFVLTCLAAGGGAGVWYFKWTRQGGLAIESTGEVRYRAARTSEWKPAPKDLRAHEKDRFQVGDLSSIKMGSKLYGPGVYEVAQDEEGHIGLISSKSEGFDWKPGASAGSAGLVFGEAELSGLQEELALHKELPPLMPTRELMALGGLSLELKDFEVQLLEPPSGRRLTPGSDIWLHWTPVPFEDVRYSVEIAGSMQFTGATLRPTRTNRLTVSLPGRGFYFWRVRATRRGRSILSKAFSFEVR